MSVWDMCGVLDMCGICVGYVWDTFGMDMCGICVVCWICVGYVWNGYVWDMCGVLDMCGIRLEWICVGYVWCAGYLWDMCEIRLAWDMCGICVGYVWNGYVWDTFGIDMCGVLDMCGICVVWDTPTIFWRKNPATKRLSGKTKNWSNWWIDSSEKYHRQIRSPGIGVKIERCFKPPAKIVLCRRFPTNYPSKKQPIILQGTITCLSVSFCLYLPKEHASSSACAAG